MNKMTIIVVFAVMMAGFSTGSDARTLQLEDYLDLENVSSPQISPDGKTIVYTRSRVDVKKDRKAPELWIMNADGTGNRRLQEDGGSVQWSPNGDRIAYVAKTESGSEIFVRWMMPGGSTTQITHQNLSPSDLSWSPDGKTIAFRGKVPAHTEWTVSLPGRPEGADWTGDATVIDRLHYRMDGTGLTAGTYTHIFTVSAEGGTPKQLTSGKWHAEARKAGMTFYKGSLEWTPDSRHILFGANKEVDEDTDYGVANVYSVAIADGHIRTLSKQKGFWGGITGPRVSPGGKLIAYLGHKDSRTSNYPPVQLRVMSRDGENDRVLIDDMPGGVSFLRWSKDNKGLYYVVGKHGSDNIHYVSLTGKYKNITQGQHSYSLSSVSEKGLAVGTLTDAYNTPDIVRLDLSSGRDMQKLTRVNDDILADVQLGKVEEIWYPSSDNTRVQGWIVYPPDFNKQQKYPLILSIHGGPEGMYRGNFNFTYQDMAAQGYIVLYTNPRGSTGYGAAFSNAIYNAYPGRVDYDDLMNGVDKVVERGNIDKERMYVQGCSGGGTLTAWVVTKTDRFAGATALCPIVNMISFAGSADIPGWAYNRYKKPFWEDPSAWLESSSIMQINQVKTPTMVMVGENDIRTPVDQSIELYSALKLLGVPTKLILMKNEWHGTSRMPSNMLRTQLYLRKWYDQWRRVERSSGPDWVEAK